MELTIDQALQKAVEAHKAGQIQEADRLYTAILKAQPKHPDANHNMGVLAVGVGKVETALPFFESALEANPKVAQFWLSYIDALIKLDRLTDAKAVLDQAKSKGAKGDGFDQLEQRLNETGEEPGVASEMAAEALPPQPNILDSLTQHQAISLAKKKAKEGDPEEAKRIYQAILTKFPKNSRARSGLKKLTGGRSRKASKFPDPPQDQLQSLINLYEQRKLNLALKQSTHMVAAFPNSAALLNIHGVILKGLGQLQLSIKYFDEALSIKPDYAIAHNNMGNALQYIGKYDEAHDAYKNAIAIEPGYAHAHYNIGNTLRKQGKLDAAIESFRMAVFIKTDYVLAYNNMGVTFQENGEPEQAIRAYYKALSVKPDYDEAHYNIGVTLQEQGKSEEAIKAFNKALSIRPDYAEAHRNLSNLVKYKPNDYQINQVFDLLQQSGLSDFDQCQLHYACAKMKEDLGDMKAAFDHYVTAGNFKKKELSYDFSKDQDLYAKIKSAAEPLKNLTIDAAGEVTKHTPVFILGMPRSGTTLVEQIVSSHSCVMGAGELNYVSFLGNQLALGQTAPTPDAVSVFREHYLAELSRRTDHRVFVTDKNPLNFRYIALICAAFPEAKIIHVQRDSKATCWSNFKHYFASKDLGYSYNLSDTVKYYSLYKDLMNFWYQLYDGRIYNLDYDKLTEEQELETRRCIEYLELNWEDACLAPQDNSRSVRTVSQLQVRQKVYTGSSQAWRKYQSYIGRVFDNLH